MMPPMPPRITFPLFACFSMLFSAGCHRAASEAVSPTGLPSLSLPPFLPDISGLALFGDHRFIAIRDSKKIPRSGPATDRLALVTIDAAHSVAFTPIPLDVPHADLPRDLESIAPVPGTTDRFFLLESGGNNTQRRLFPCTITAAPSGQCSVVLAAPPIDLRPHTKSFTNIESLVALPIDSPAPDEAAQPGDTLLILADRVAHDQNVLLVSLTLRDGTVIHSREWTTPAPSTRSLVPATSGSAGTPDPDASTTGEDDTGQSVRVCSEFLLAPDHHLYISSCFDGGLRGPYSSLITRLGTIDGARFIPDPVLASVAVPTHKIEALAPFPAKDGSWSLLLGADDESLGGYFQLIQPPAPPPLAPSATPGTQPPKPGATPAETSP